MNLSEITTIELEKKIIELQSKATPLRQKVLKELDDLGLLYQEVLLYKAEIDKRLNEKE